MQLHFGTLPAPTLHILYHGIHSFHSIRPVRSVPEEGRHKCTESQRQSPGAGCGAHRRSSTTGRLDPVLSRLERPRKAANYKGFYNGKRSRGWEVLPDTRDERAWWRTWTSAELDQYLQHHHCKNKVDSTSKQTFWMHSTDRWAECNAICLLLRAVRHYR